MANAPHIIVNETRTAHQQKMRKLQSFLAPGRRSGKLPGTHIDDLSARLNCILLCGGCKHKFDHMRHDYFYEKNIRVSATCDGCDEHTMSAHMYIHESTVVQNRRSRHGDSWLPII
jgi:hypothetical protein